MNNANSEKRGHVIPKWLQPKVAFSKGELQIPRKTPLSLNKATKVSIENELAEFRGNPTRQGACYLLGASLLSGDEGLAHEMARFVRDQGSPTDTITELADNVLGIEHIDIGLLRINVQIARIKAWLRDFPRSATAWIELGRLYTIKGRKDKARRAVLTALSLAPYDRYIGRCGVRFFLHILDYDAAWTYINAANDNVRDPWLKATGINVAMMTNRKIPAPKGIVSSNLQGTDLFHYSELHESAGMLELNSGNQKKAKKHFRTAWSNPPESVVTHGEWVVRNKLPTLKDTSLLDYAKSLEALTWVHYYECDFPAAIDTVRLWQEEEPYSRSAFVVASCIAGNAGLHDDAVDFASEGLLANPNDARLLHGLCYSLLRSGRIDDAKDAFKRWEQALDDRDNNVFYLATAGLLMFKIGNVIEGRRLYLDAISKCKDRDDKLHVDKAYLNLALAEIDAATPEAPKTAAIALDMSNDDKHPDIISLREEVMSKAGPRDHHDKQ